MSETTTVSTQTTEEQLAQALVDRAKNTVASISVDGVSTSYQSADPIQALTALARQKAAKNPLAAIKIFKVKS